MPQGFGYGGYRGFDPRRSIAESFLTQGLSNQPTSSIAGGINKVAQALLGTYLTNRIGSDDRARSLKSAEFAGLTPEQADFLGPEGVTQIAVAKMKGRGDETFGTGKIFPLEGGGQAILGNRGTIKPVEGLLPQPNYEKERLDISKQRLKATERGIDRQIAAQTASDARFQAGQSATESRFIRGQEAAEERLNRQFREAKEAAERKPPTEAQSKASLFAQRTEDANKTISELQSQVASSNPATALAQKKLEGTAIGTAIVPESIQQQRQAERNFLNAVLRRESGAVISPTEFEEGARQYFPMPGEGEKVLAQKARNRQIVIDSLKREAGKALPKGGFDFPQAPSSAAVPADPIAAKRAREILIKRGRVLE